MEKIRNWIIRQRDRTSASYSRFGRPGEEEDDRPPPTTILVAPFNENSSQFMFFSYWHVQKATMAMPRLSFDPSSASSCVVWRESAYGPSLELIEKDVPEILVFVHLVDHLLQAFACFGMSMVILLFISSFFEFDWYHHQRGVDVGALLGLFFYLALGVLIHYYVLYGIKKQNSLYLLPFIVVYSVICTGELFLFFALLFKVMDPQTAIGQTTMHPPLVSMLIVVIITIIVQAMMLQAVLKCREFLSLKAIHEMELKVAEKSRTENPSIQIVVADNTGSYSAATNGNVV